jgi:hypothetical protein
VSGQQKTTLRYARANYGGGKDFDIVNEHGGRVASTPYEQHAKRIVRACNSHDELVRLLTYAVTYSSAKGIFPEGFLEDATAALQVSK